MSKNLNKIIIGTILCLGYCINSCKNPLTPIKESEYKIKESEYETRTVISARIEDESTQIITPEEIENLEQIISENYSGYDLIHTNLPITLEWDSDRPSEDKEYYLYAKKSSDLSNIWIYLGKSSSDRKFEIPLNPRGIIMTGAYILGVKAVDYEENISEIHQSIDNTAEPSNGWYTLISAYSPADTNFDKKTTTDELITYIRLNGYTPETIQLSVDDWYNSGD